MLPFHVFHGLLLLGMVQDNGDPEKEENILKPTARSRNISSHSYRLFVSHSSPGLTKHQPIKKKKKEIQPYLPWKGEHFICEVCNDKFSTAVTSNS